MVIKRGFKLLFNPDPNFLIEFDWRICGWFQCIRALVDQTAGLISIKTLVSERLIRNCIPPYFFLSSLFFFLSYYFFSRRERERTYGPKITTRQAYTPTHTKGTNHDHHYCNIAAHFTPVKTRIYTLWELYHFTKYKIYLWH